MPERKLPVIFLVTEEVDSLVRFYRDVVGLALSRHEPGDSAWFDLGEVQLAIHRPESEGSAGGDFTPEASTIVWFEPEEGVSEAAARIESAGVPLIRPGEARNYVYFRDPEGRMLGFHQRG